MSHLALFPAETALLGSGDPGFGAAADASSAGELFFHVVEQSSVAISITDPDAHIIYSNQAFSRLTGFSRSELKGRNHNVLAVNRRHTQPPIEAMWSTLESRRSWSGRPDQQAQGWLLVSGRGDGDTGAR